MIASMSDLDLTFTAKLWVYSGKSAWFFVTLPKVASEQIKLMSHHKRRGWGSVPVTARIGKSEWKTSVFPDTKAGAYLLPVKSDIRHKESIVAGDSVSVRIRISV
jgi:hypothetical protein